MRRHTGARRPPDSARSSQRDASDRRPEDTDARLEESEKPEAAPGNARAEGRGRHAEKPGEIPKQGWLDILLRTKQQIGEDNLPIVAAGVAFFWFVAIVPTLVVVISMYGYVADPAQVPQHIESMAQVVPGEAMPLLEEQLSRITSEPRTAGFGALIGLLIALFGSAKATKALITGLNIAYDEREKRGFFKLNAVALLLTLGAIVGALIAIGLLAIVPVVLERLPIGSGTETLLIWLRWPVLVGGFMLALAIVYRFGPSRRIAKWRWVSWGAVVAAFLWLLGSGAFSLYVRTFAGYDKTYGPLGTVVIFLLWLLITALAVLIGAELNAEMERQTLEDSTTNPQKPLGERHAKAADTVGPSREEMPEKKQQ